jgi:small GTP-binding protein
MIATNNIAIEALNSSANVELEGENAKMNVSALEQDRITAMLGAAAAQKTVSTVPVESQRCGLIAIVGKPNVGKSTLLNALVGQKISITSRKAQTTRHRITGMSTRGEVQFVFVDTPGFQTLHGNALNRSLNKAVQGAVGDVDLVLFVVEAGRSNMADDNVVSLLSNGIPTLLIANKRSISLTNLYPCPPKTPKTLNGFLAYARNTSLSNRGCMTLKN